MAQETGYLHHSRSPARRVILPEVGRYEGGGEKEVMERRRRNGRKEVKVKGKQATLKYCGWCNTG